MTPFTAGADLKTHAPEWQTVGPMVGREGLEDGLCSITRGPLSHISKPIIASINGWCVGHGVELAMACDLRIASDRAQFGTFEIRRGMHPADGGIVQLVNTCDVGVALELLLMGEPISAERAYTANMVNRVVPHDELEAQTEHLVMTILRCDQAAIESATETVLEIIGRPLHDQLRVRRCRATRSAPPTRPSPAAPRTSSTRSTEAAQDRPPPHSEGLRPVRPIRNSGPDPPSARRTRSGP